MAPYLGVPGGYEGYKSVYGANEPQAGYRRRVREEVAGAWEIDRQSDGYNDDGYLCTHGIA